ncbi:MAG: cobyrinate a,c-diamide synthase [Ruminiclostridium sp.]|nr:cobyrinate a,c-diamide synthase [Ruminiclostridium sp.]
MKRIIIAGTHSGCGKTTVTCAVLSALKARGLRVSAFKCGPDYIDPMFHREVIGVPSHNLDSFFCGDSTLRYLLDVNSAGSDIAVTEGVMVFYDGSGGRGSAYSLSEVTETPAVIVLDCKGMSDSLGAVMKGFLTYRENRIAGFVFNRLPERLVQLAERLCGELGTTFFGYLPKTEISVESRHLGLVTAEEISDIRYKLRQLGELAERHIGIDDLIESAECGELRCDPPVIPPPAARRRPVIAIAKDKAFCFIYADNTDLLERMGCEIRFFSPLADRHVPEDADGLILCGGYPELYAEELSANGEMLRDIRERINSGLPTIAECGGFMYLHSYFEDMDGNAYRGADVIHGKAYRTDKLQRFGYVTLKANSDNLLCGNGAGFPAHEFHYFDSTVCGNGFTASRSDGRKWECVNSSEVLYAGFPHLYFYAEPAMAVNFVKRCVEYGNKRNNTGR